MEMALILTVFWQKKGLCLVGINISILDSLTLDIACFVTYVQDDIWSNYKL